MSDPNDKQQKSPEKDERKPEQPQRQASSNQWIPPTTGNPDLDPVSQHGLLGQLPSNPLIPQGMIYDPSRLLDSRQPNSGVPPGARFDPFGPPDPDSVCPGRGPLPSSQFSTPDPDHFMPPGQPPPGPLGSGKSLKFPWPPGGRGPGGSGNFPPPGGAGGSPFQ